MTHVPIVAISNNKLAFALATLFTQLLQTKKPDTFYELNALVTPDFLPSHIDKITSLAQQFAHHCHLNIVKMTDDLPQFANHSDHVPDMATYKFYLAEKFPQYQKIIYLDTDLVIFQDLTPLYQTDLNQKYLGGVQSLAFYLNSRHLAAQLGINHLANYINSGVLLMDLAAIRHHQLEHQCRQLVGSFPDTVDQHIINKVYHQHIQLLSPQWNVFNFQQHLYQSDLALIGMTPAQQSTVLHQPAIFHYTGCPKPWQYYNLQFGLIWYRAYLASPYGSEPLVLEFCADAAGQGKPTNWFTKIYYRCRATLALKRRWRQIFGAQH